jgi:hypothetical protein
MRAIRVSSLGLTLCALVVLVGSVEAQVRGPADIYIRTLRSMISEWNERRPVSKEGLTDEFATRVATVLRARADRPELGFENELWYREVIRNWETLPTTLVPTRRISPSAALLLEILFRNNLPAFAMEVPAQESAIRRALRLPWFLILGTAQRRARGDAITSEDIVAVVADYFTGIWPFCPTRR